MPKISVSPLDSMNSSRPNTRPLRTEKTTSWVMVGRGGAGGGPARTAGGSARPLHLAGGGLRGLVAIHLALQREAEAGGVEVVLDVLVGVHGDVDRHLELVILAPHDHLVAADVGVLHALQGLGHPVDVGGACLP